MAITSYDNCSMGEAYVSQRKYWTLNPERKERKERTQVQPKDEILYRDRFILRPVYRTHDAAGHWCDIRFLGYVLMMRDAGHYWKMPRKLAEVKAHADKVLEQIRACEAIAAACQALAPRDVAHAA